MRTDMKKYILMIALSAFGFSSCETLLDKTPQAQLTPDSFYRTAEDFQLITNPYYNNILDKTPYDEQSDQCVVHNPSNKIRGGTFRIVPAEGGGWTWASVRNINTTLSFLAECEDEAVVREYAAVCRFFRALEYAGKVMLFGDVPWIDKELGSTDSLLYAPRDSRELVMSHVVEDLDAAAAGLPAKYDNGHNYRATKWAALALKSRICLFEGTFRKYHQLSLDGHDWQYYLEQAAEAAERLMTESPHRLYSTGKPYEDYVRLFSAYEENAGEYIFSVDYDAGRKMFHNATAATLMITQGGRSLTRKFVNAYLMKDGARFTDRPGWETMMFAQETKDRDPRLGQTIRIPGYKRIHGKTAQGPDLLNSVTGYQLVKFVMPADNEFGDRFDQSYNDLPIIRLAEVYLNFAEAKAELGTLTQDDLDRSVNLIRARAGMPDLNLAAANADPDPYLASPKYGYSNVGGADKGVILEIRRERAVEMAGEGLRYPDLLRWKAGKSMEQPIEGLYFPGAGVYDIDGDGKADVSLYAAGESPAAAPIKWQIGKDVFLSEGGKGCLLPYHGYVISFDEARDYFNPIPINDRSLNHKLAQNPGWEDGLKF